MRTKKPVHYPCEYCGTLTAETDLLQDAAGNYACPQCRGVSRTGGRVVVTRHPALVQYLREEGYIPADAEVIPHATPENIRGKYVWGVLPLRLTALAASITEIPLDLPAERRGQELTIEQVRQYAGKPVTYTVSRA